MIIGLMISISFLKYVQLPCADQIYDLEKLPQDTIFGNHLVLVARNADMVILTRHYTKFALSLPLYGEQGSPTLLAGLVALLFARDELFTYI